MTDIASFVKVTNTGAEELTRAADNYSTRIEQTLGMIEAIEKNLREKRKRIEEIQARHEDLELQYRQLGKSLDSATAELTQHFAGVISNLGNDGAISKPLACGASATVVGSSLAPEKPELPPIPECTPEVQESSNEDGVILDSLQTAFNRRVKRRTGPPRSRHTESKTEAGE